MLRNPAYAGKAVFGKTMVINESPGLNRRARLQGRTTPRASKTVDRPREHWVEIAVPAIVSAETFDRVGARLADNKRFASRNSKVPSLLQGLAACAGCGYGYYRTSTRTTNKKIYYYRCLGSDDYRYEGGRVCTNKPVRADYLDTVVWDHITGLLTGPHLIRAEIDKRLHTARTADPTTRQRTQLQLALAKATTGITRMIEAFGEQLITIDELRAHMPDLRTREANLRGQIDALDSQLADQHSYLKLASNLEGFLAQLRDKAHDATVEDRQRVLRLLVKDVLVGPEKITIRHRIPIRERTTTSEQPDSTDTEGDQRASCQVRWGRNRCPLRRSLPSLRPLPVLHDPCGQPLADQPQDPPVRDPMLEKLLQPTVIKTGEEVADIRVEHPVHLLPRDPDRERIQRLMRVASRPEPVRKTQEIHLINGVEHLDDGPLDNLVLQRGDAKRPLPPVRLRDVRTPRRSRSVTPRMYPREQVGEIRFQPLLVGSPRHPVHPRRGLRADRPISLPEPVDIDVMQQRREPRFLVPSRHFTHTLQRTGRAWPGSVSGTRFAGRVPLGWAPFLHRLRLRSHGLVRRFHRYYAPI
jgi:recombinase-like zinc beta ribbon protein/recombinase